MVNPPNTAVLVLSKQQVIWLKDLIKIDILEWQDMASRPVDEVGLRFSHLAKNRVDTMQNLLAKLDVIESVRTISDVNRRYKGLVPEIMLNYNDVLAVMYDD